MTSRQQPEDFAARREANDLTEAEFCARFKAEMIRIAGQEFGDGESIGEYADRVSPTYYAEDWQREDGPEECASADIGEWS